MPDRWDALGECAEKRQRNQTLADALLRGGCRLPVKPTGRPRRCKGFECHRALCCKLNLARVIARLPGHRFAQPFKTALATLD